MPRRSAAPNGRRAPAVGAVAAAAILAGSWASPISRAQPAPVPVAGSGSPEGSAGPGPGSGIDLERAKDLYKSAEAAMQDGRHADALRDYGAAYELSKDPALFFKIGNANEKSGKCDVALTYFVRYLRQGQPTPQFVATTNEHIAACGGLPGGSDADAGSATAAGSGARAGSAAPPVPPGPATGSASGATGWGAASPGEAAAGSGAGSAAAVPVGLSNQGKVAWLLSGSALALITLGGVLAYASSSSENDVRDLYVGFGNKPPAFDAQTRGRYDDLLDQGRRYQHLSWAAFGLAGAAAAGATVLFVLDHPNDHASETPRVAPVVTPRSAGVRMTF